MKEDRIDDNKPHGKQERLHALLRSMPDIVFMFSKIGFIIDSHGTDTSGILPPPEQMIGKYACEVLPPMLCADIKKHLATALDSDETVISDFSYGSKERKRFVEGRFTKCGEDEVLVLLRDITKQKEFERSLTKLLEEVSNAKHDWETTFNAVSEFIVITDTSYRIIRGNKSFAEFAGKNSLDLPGTDLSDILQLSPEDRSKNLAMLNEGIHMPQAWLASSGKWLYMSHRLITDPFGQPSKIVVTISDITDVMEAQKELLRTDKELKERVEELERFYNMVIGRELKMRELKKRIAQLEKELSYLSENRVNEL